MNIDLRGLDEEFSSSKPTDLETVYYLFWEKGLSLKEFNELPIPYILGILKTFSYVKDEEAKAYKKVRK